MTEQFYDSSSFAKLFINEAGTYEMLQLYRMASQRRIVSRILFVEVYSAIRRVEREGKVKSADALQALSLLLDEQNNVETIELTDSVLNESRSLLDRYPLRSLDAIQLASCKLAKAVFICADKKLKSAAISEGLQVVDPLSM